MPEQKFEVKPVGVAYVCDACGEGEMQQVGKLHYEAEKVLFPHTCNHCGHKQDFYEKYPLVRFEGNTGVKSG